MATADGGIFDNAFSGVGLLFSQGVGAARDVFIAREERKALTAQAAQQAQTSTSAWAGLTQNVKLVILGAIAIAGLFLLARRSR